MADRSAVRFVVAPYGYGKSHVALEYAEVVFSFQHTVWFRCDSPCFLRDLDDELILQECLEVDNRLRLVVFDDLPKLDEARLAKFANLVNELVESECEVLVTCVPACRPPMEFSARTLVLEPIDLLLTDEECLAGHTRYGNAEERLHTSDRVALLVWGDEADKDKMFLDGVAREPMAAREKAALVGALILRVGRTADFARIGIADLAEIERMAHDYPHFGIDVRTGSFETPAFDVSLISRRLKRSMAQDACACGFESLDEAARYWARLLVERKRSGRACEVVRLLCTRARAVSWVLDNGRALSKAACALGVIDLLDKSDTGDSAVDARIDVEIAERYLMLGESDLALSRIKYLVTDKRAEDGTRALACIFVSRYAQGMAATHANEVLAEIVRRALVKMQQAYGAVRYASEESFWIPLAQAQVFLGSHAAHSFVERWRALVDTGADRDALLLCASWVFDCFNVDKAAGDGVCCALANVDLRALDSYVRSVVDAGVEGLDYFAMRAITSLERARMEGADVSQAPIDVSSLIEVRHMEMRLASQKRTLIERANASSVKRSNKLETNPESYLDVRYAVRGASIEVLAPTLSIKLFGPMLLTVGDRVVPSKLLRRRRTRVLLAMLAANMGREVPRDKIISTLWPTLGFEAGRKNFYTVWSELRCALVLNDGNCPYLIRHQNGCSLNARVATSDVQRLDEICRTLMFEPAENVDWVDVQGSLDESFRDDFLPDETDCEFVMNVRADYKERLVDALVVASKRLSSQGFYDYGMWFARFAVMRDPLREDAYASLMLAQESSGQRIAALSTYMKCRNVLRDELGIDPSSTMSVAYERLIGA